MRVILNYKSLYEAVKVGVTNDGYTPVTRLLFFPVFDPKGDILPCDDNGIPYAVDTKNANAWCKGEDNIPVNIKTAVGKKSTLEALIKYYKSKDFTDQLYEATEDEMYEAVVDIVKNCEDVSDTAKKALLKVYRSGEKLEFLARVFQRAVRGENKVVSKSRKKKAADTDADSVTEFNKLVRKRKPRVKVPKKVQPPELNYVTQLYLAYHSATGKTITKPEDLDPLDYREHFEHQRKTFYMAETVHSEIRDSVMPNEADPFDELTYYYKLLFPALRANMLLPQEGRREAL
ncbi:MAG: hypothetical protein IJ225_05255 [Solobacterium sp.]|nr:hypothetical protein [Solobacterium sp.]